MCRTCHPHGGQHGRAGAVPAYWSAGGGCPAGGATRGSAGASLERQAAPVQTRLHAVAHLRLGERGHRVRIPAEIHPYSAGIKGGIVGGIAMAIVAVAYGIIAHGSPWYPINLLAAAALPMPSQMRLEELTAFHALALIIALVSHAVLSLLVGLLYAAMLPMLPRHPAFWGGSDPTYVDGPDLGFST